MEKDDMLTASAFFSEFKKAANEVQLKPILQAADAIFEAWKNSRTVYAMGNGGSAATASHFVCDLSKWTAAEGKPRIRAVSLNENMPLISALSNDIGFDSVYTEQLKNFGIGRADVLIGFSTLGSSRANKDTIRSNNLLDALKYAHSCGAATIGFIGFDGGLMKDFCDIPVIIPVSSVQHVESLHLPICHLISQLLKEKINAH